MWWEKCSSSTLANGHAQLDEGEIEPRWYSPPPLSPRFVRRGGMRGGCADEQDACTLDADAARIAQLVK